MCVKGVKTGQKCVWMVSECIRVSALDVLSNYCVIIEKNTGMASPISIDLSRPC